MNKRVEIAKDVLSQIAAERIVACPGQYIDTDARCQVCALGSMFRVLVDDAAFEVTKTKNVSKQLADIREVLLDHFSSEQLGLIECAFEGAVGYINVDDYEDTDDLPAEVESALAYADKYEDPQDRLVAIMQNIVDNDGMFVP